MTELKFSLLAVTAALTIAASVAQAQQPWPSKPIRVIIPHPAGGPADVPPRAMGPILAQALGQPFIIENRLGADGIIGSEVCAKAAPDGYTFCTMSNGVSVVNPVLVAKMPFDAARDLLPVVHTGTLYSVVMVGSATPVNSMRELIEVGRAKPDSLTWGVYGQIAPSYFITEWLRVKAGARYLQVPYKGASQALQVLLAGEVQVSGYALGATRTHMQSGKVRALAVNSDKRLASIPDIPTLKETGVDVSFRAWFGFYAPARTPASIVHRLNTEIAKLVLDPAFAGKYIIPQGFETDSPAGASPEEFAKFLHSDREEFQRLVNTIGFKLQ
jgi:tripartite-type tricarboxylate transporter receptor subunit TctC